MRDGIDAGLKALGLTPPPGAADRLAEYGRLLLEWNQAVNLTAITQPDQVVALHFLDCAALLCAQDVRGKSLIDVGSGAGFPGLVLKILEPSLSLTLLDGLGKRVSFLRALCSALGLDDVTLLHARAEEESRREALREQFDLATARAVAPLYLLCELCLPFVRPGGRFLAMKSTDSDDEVQRAQRAISLLGGGEVALFDYAIAGTGVVHRVVTVEKSAPTPECYPRRWAKMHKTPL